MAGFDDAYDKKMMQYSDNHDKEWSTLKDTYYKDLQSFVAKSENHDIYSDRKPIDDNKVVCDKQVNQSEDYVIADKTVEWDETNIPKKEDLIDSLWFAPNGINRNGELDNIKTTLKVSDVRNIGELDYNEVACDKKPEIDKEYTVPTKLKGFEYIKEKLEKYPAFKDFDNNAEQSTVMHIAGLSENSNGYLVSWHKDNKIKYDFVSDDDVPPYPAFSDKILAYLESICPDNSKFARAYSKNGKVRGIQHADLFYKLSDETKQVMGRTEGHKVFADLYSDKHGIKSKQITSVKPDCPDGCAGTGKVIEQNNETVTIEASITRDGGKTYTKEILTMPSKYYVQPQKHLSHSIGCDVVKNSDNKA